MYLSSYDCAILARYVHTKIAYFLAQISCRFRYLSHARPTIVLKKSAYLIIILLLYNIFGELFEYDCVHGLLYVQH